MNWRQVQLNIWMVHVRGIETENTTVTDNLTQFWKGSRSIGKRSIANGGLFRRLRAMTWGIVRECFGNVPAFSLHLRVACIRHGKQKCWRSKPWSTSRTGRRRSASRRPISLGKCGSTVCFPFGSCRSHVPRTKGGGWWWKRGWRWGTENFPGDVWDGTNRLRKWTRVGFFITTSACSTGAGQKRALSSSNHKFENYS